MNNEKNDKGNMLCFGADVNTVLDNNINLMVAFLSGWCSSCRRPLKTLYMVPVACSGDILVGKPTSVELS